jgi:DNA-binding LacI/PurR family transcriptional regulator/biotin operon repressor
MSHDIVRSLPLYAQIAQQIRTQIAQGELQVGDRLPSEAELCQRYGASRVTVRKAIESLVKEGVVHAKVGKGTFVGAEPTTDQGVASVQPMRVSTLTDMVGFISIGDSTPFALDILHGIQKAADLNNTHIIFANANYDRHQQARHIAALRERQVAGLLIMPTFEADDTLKQLAREQYPTVLIDRYFEDVALPCITSDNRGGGYQAARYLFELGHQRVAFIGRVPMSTSQERWAGYHSAQAYYGIPQDERLTLSLDTVPHDEALILNSGYPTDSVAYPFVRQFLEQQRPSAVICHNPYFALVTLTALRDLGLRVAEDVSLISFDRDVQGTFSNCPLTIITQNGFHIGETAFLTLQRALVGMHVGPRVTRIAMRLVVHESCRRFTG